MKYKIFLLVLSAPLFLTHNVSNAQTVSGNNFELRDPHGALTAQLTTSSEGTPGLFFFDANRTVRISVGLYPDGAPGVVLNDDTGKAAAIVRLVQNNGNPVVVLKEGGQDKLILDTNGASGGVSSLLVSIFLGFVAGMVGGLFVVFVSKRKTAQPQVPQV